MSGGARSRAAAALTLAAPVLLVLAALLGYARYALLDPEQFADRTTASLRDDSVKSVIGERVTDGLVLRGAPDLLAARPLVVSAVSSIVGGGAFGGLFHRAALDAHRAVLERDQNTLVLTVADLGTVASAALEKLRPDLAAQLRTQHAGVVLERIRLGEIGGDLARTADRIRVLSWILAALTALAAIGALWLSADRRRTVARLGAGTATAGVLIVVAYTAARAIFLAHIADPELRAAAAGVWGAFLGDLRTLGWALAGIGCVTAAAADSLLHPVRLERFAVRGWRIVSTEPRTTGHKLLRAGALIVAGGIVIAEPSAVLRSATIVAGALIAYRGIEAGLRAIYRPDVVPAVRPRRARLWLVVSLAAVVAAGSAGTFVAVGGITAPEPAVPTCDGSATLCDKPLDQVVLPATHNSMAAALPGWLSSVQEKGIAGQLQDGIRGLQIDTHYGDKLANGRVRTDFGPDNDPRALAEQDGISEQDVEAALRLRDRLGFEGSGERGMYLCHTFCELGFTPLADALGEIHDFLVTHPYEVVMVINQDYVTPADFVKAVDDAGLGSYVYTGDPDRTLRQMIDAGTRLVIMAENHAGAAPWYRPAYEHELQETPFSFSSAAQLTDPAQRAASCVPHRGPASAPLFLINHWVTTDPVPRPADADRVNAYAPLLARAQACEKQRHHVPNLIAVNFYRRGDLFRVVRTLNGE